MRGLSRAMRMAAGPRSTPASALPKLTGTPMMLTRRPPPGGRCVRVSFVCAARIDIEHDGMRATQQLTAQVDVEAAATAARLGREEGLEQSGERRQVARLD